MLKDPAADPLPNLLSAIMQRWDDHSRAKVSAAEDQGHAVLRDNSPRC